MPETVPQYELAYHLKPELEETRVAQLRTELEQLLTANGATIQFSKEPEKTRLSYPIAHQRQSFFGYTQFTLENTEALAAADEHLRLNPDVIRHVLLKVEPESEKIKAARALAGQREQARRIRQRAEVTPQTPAQPANPEEMEKQLEEIISGL